MSNLHSMSHANAQITSWVNEYSDELLRYTIFKVSDRVVAEDLVQNTFLAAFTAFSQFKKESSPKTWLYAILKNKIADFHRANFKKVEIKINDNEAGLDYFFDKSDHWKNETSPIAWRSEEHLLDNTDFNNALKFCMNKLPAQWHSALQLKYMEERDGKIICQELNITATNFWQILHRAKLQLRACLEINWFKK